MLEWLRIEKPSLLAACLLVSFFIWLLTALDEEHSYSIPIYISYQNLPQDKIPVVPLPSQLKANLKGRGFALLRQSIFRKSIPININLKQYKNGKNISVEEFYSQISEGLNNLSITDLYPSSIMIDFEDKISKKVPIYVESKLEFKPFFFQQDAIHLSPDSVLITGPASIIDSLLNWPIKMLTLKNIDIYQNGEIELFKSGNSNVSIIPKKVSYELMVDQWTEKTIKAPIQAINLPQEYKAILVPNTAQISLQLPLSQYELITDSLVQIAADFSNIDIMKTASISLTANVLDSRQIRNIQIKPEIAEFFIYE